MTISIVNEVPEALHTAMQVFVESHPSWDVDRVMAAALSLFLLQQAKDADRAISE